MSVCMRGCIVLFVLCCSVSLYCVFLCSVRVLWCACLFWIGLFALLCFVRCVLCFFFFFFFFCIVVVVLLCCGVLCIVLLC